MSHPGICFICNQSLDNGVQLRTMKQKGINSLINKSKEKNDEKWKVLQNLSEVTIHELCRMNYFLLKKKETAVPAPTPEKQTLFDFKNNCFLCAHPSNFGHKPGKLVVTQQLQDTILQFANLRKDEWAQEVKKRIESILLREVHARYHCICYTRFKSLPNDNPPGRPKIVGLEAAFQGLCNYIESSDDCQFSINELINKLEGWTTTVPTLKQKLLNKYGEDILFVGKKGKPTIVCFRNTGYKILMDSWYENRKKNVTDERLRVVQAAADIIREDIKSKAYDTSSYPPPSELLENVEADIPESLTIFLNNVLLKNKNGNEKKLQVKRNSIAHSIVSIVRPRSFTSSIQLATGVYFTRKFGSRLIIDVLNSLGFCTSYTNISLYEASAVMKTNKNVEDHAYVQYVFDNADHNVCTLDGFNTFHNMGGICCITPKGAVTHQGKINKLTELPKAKELAAKVNVPIVHCNNSSGNQEGLKSITFVDVAELNLGKRQQLPTAYALHIWAKLLSLPDIPSWRGFMEAVSFDAEYEVSQIFCMPFVNLPPSDRDTINTVLNMAAKEAKDKNQKHVFVTFDQPLFIKAIDIVESDALLALIVIVRLGGFHFLMSLLGALGTVMDGSGLKELLCIIYATNSVDHILTGHAFSRAIRAHLLIYTALGTIIAGHASDVTDEERNYVASLLKDFANEPPTLREINEDDKLIGITSKITMAIKNLLNLGRTSQLWLQYFHCITLVMQFIEAERLGDWQLHLQCVRDALPFFHAAGHFQYAKSGQIYLQSMEKLPDIMNPDEYKKFTTEGHFTIRRSDKNWAGVWTDMTVEQTLMRIMKISGGLTSGRGINKEGVIARWILGMPVAFEVMEAFETFSGVRPSTSEQHTDWRPSSMKRDTEDYSKLVQWFQAHDPFAPAEPEKIMSIADGLCGGEQVNCDRAIVLGEEAMKAMVGHNAAEVKLKRTSRVKSIATTKRGIMINNDVVAINTTLLFQRITAITKDDQELATIALNYELSPFPLALFDEQGMMRKSKKSDLYNAFSAESVKNINLKEFRIVLDGGCLLHKVVWPLGCTYQQVFGLYKDYLLKKYGGNLIVVFDGYKGVDVSIKSYERSRRLEKNMGSQVLFHQDMPVTLSQSKFLSNDDNKDRLISFLKIEFEAVGIAVRQAAEDADRLIATTAIEELNIHDHVVVIGQDVDLMVLLTALTPPERDISFIKLGTARTPDTLYSTQRHQYLKDTILFVHAFTGCDTTSAVYQKGKKSILKILKKKSLENDVAVFQRPNSTPSEVEHAGERLMLALYAAPAKKTSINEFRFDRFALSTARLQTQVRLAQLPPTAGATAQHAFRVYLQIQKWIGNDLDPRDWGWELKQQVFFPLMSRTPPAPESILKMIFCTCKGSCTGRCSCRKAGLKCSSICSGCHGNACCNSMTIELDPEMSENSSDSTDFLLRGVDSIITSKIDETRDINESSNFPETFDEDDFPVFEVYDDDEPSMPKRQRLE